MKEVRLGLYCGLFFFSLVAFSIAGDVGCGEGGCSDGAAAILAAGILSWLSSITFIVLYSLNLAGRFPFTRIQKWIEFGVNCGLTFVWFFCAIFAAVRSAPANNSFAASIALSFVALAIQAALAVLVFLSKHGYH